MKGKQLTLFGILIGGALLTLPVPSHAAFAGRTFSHSGLANDIRSDRNEIQRDRQDLREDRRNLQQDRDELREDRRDDASAGEIAKDRADVRQDRRDIVRDERSLQAERRDLSRDLEQKRSWFDWRHWWWNWR